MLEKRPTLKDKIRTNLGKVQIKAKAKKAQPKVGKKPKNKK